MADSKDDSSTIEKTEVNSEFEEVLEAFNEMHEESSFEHLFNHLHLIKTSFSKKGASNLQKPNETI